MPLERTRAAVILLACSIRGALVSGHRPRAAAENDPPIIGQASKHHVTAGLPLGNNHAASKRYALPSAPHRPLRSGKRHLLSSRRRAARLPLERFPGARQLVYERRQSLPIGLAAAGRGTAVFSVVLYPRWVRFFFLEGAAIRSAWTMAATILDDPYIRTSAN
jgi:hypothetical protein